MVTIKVSEDTLLDMLTDRVGYWTNNYYTKCVYREYYRMLIDDGCFDGCEFDPMVIVDNDYVNYTAVITEDDFDDYNIEGEDDDRILYKDYDLFLISRR